MKEKRTYAQRSEYNKKAVHKRRLKLKAMAVSYKGGSCQDCGYNKCNGALVFHHVEPGTKSFSIAKIGSISWARMEKELDKCVLLCSNCHAERHALGND